MMGQSDAGGAWPRALRLIQPNLRTIDAVDLDIEGLVDAVASHGGNAILLNAGGMVAWYPTKLPFQKHNKLLTCDYLGEAVEAAHRRGLKALARLDVTKTYPEFFEAHADWFRKGPDGAPVAVGPFYETCMNGGFWQDATLRILDEILSTYPVDAIFFNSFLYRPCQSPCAACDASLERTARELDESHDAPAVRYRSMGNLAAKLHSFIHAKRPGVGFAVDMEILTDDPAHSREVGWSRAVWDKQHPVVAVAFNRITRPHPAWPHQAGEDGRYLRATLADRPTCILVTYSAIFGNRRVAQPPAQLAHDLIQAAANGAGVGVQIPGTFNQDDRRALLAMRDVFHYLAEHEDVYARARSAAKVALVYSQLTADTYAAADPVGRVLDEYRGWYEALVEGHIAFDVIDDAALTEGRLGGYRAVILPNVASLSDSACARLDEYVAAGGVLLASHETSLFDEYGRSRSGFGLRSIGRRFERTISAPGSYLSIRDSQAVPGVVDSEIVGLGAETPYGGFGPLAFPEADTSAHGPVREAEFVQTRRVSGVSRRLDLFWIPPVTTNVPEFSYFGEASEYPGLVMGRQGVGSVVYLPWMAGRLVRRYSVPGVADLLAGLVKRALPRQEVEVTAPKTLELTLHRLSPAGWLLHLINATALYTPSREPVPLGPIEVRVQASIKQAISLRSQHRFSLVRSGHSVSFTIPRVDSFEAVILD